MRIIIKIVEAVAILTVLLILGFALIWEAKWVGSMQSLSWQVKVSEVAKFTCKEKQWQADSIALKWNCYPKEQP
jgi:hypothetical protein